MKLRGNGFVLLVLAGIIVLTSSYIIFGQGQKAKQKLSTNQLTIDVNKTITMAQCQSCHDNLDTFTKLKFNHWIHFKKGLKCNTCHKQWPHQQGKIILPKKETCLNCHGLKHGNQGLMAPSNCNKCHNKTPAKPINHNKTFIASNHKKTGNSKCLLCHMVESCQRCHTANKIKVNPRILRFNAQMPQKKKAPFEKIVLKKEIDAGTCFKCHFDLNANRAKGLIFNHWPHFKKGIKCKTCHKGVIHEKGKVNRPTMSICFSCHGLNHNKQKKVAPENCKTCHTKSFNLKPKWHDSKWLKTHKKRVYKNVTYINYKSITTITSLSCFQCHEPKSFCQNCHYNKLKVKPKGNINLSKNLTRHQKAHPQKNKLCDVCHDRKTFCKKCHKAEMPHNYNWLKTHRPQAKKDRTACLVCHKKTLFCNSCHHSNVKPKNTLVVCRKCHKTYTDQFREKLVRAGAKAAAAGNKAKARQYRRFVFHWVHFPMKFNCKKCHHSDTNLELKKEVFKLCKTNGCHPDGQKEPPSGSKLCEKCHAKPHKVAKKR